MMHTHSLGRSDKIPRGAECSDSELAKTGSKDPQENSARAISGSYRTGGELRFWASAAVNRIEDPARSACRSSHRVRHRARQGQGKTYRARVKISFKYDGRK